MVRSTDAGPPSSSEPEAPGLTMPSERALLGGVLALTALVFLPVLGFHLVYDDGWILMSNGFLRSPGDLWKLLTPTAAAEHVPDAFRPTSVTFDVLAYQVLGTERIAHHALSLVLHLVVSLLLWRWLTQLRAPLPLRVASTTLFALTAAHAEVVAVVSYREDLLAAALALLALLTAGRALGSDRPARWLAATVLLASLASGAKMSAAPVFVVGALTWSLAPWRPPASARRIVLATVALAVGTALALLQTQIVYGDASPYEGQAARVLAAQVGHGPVLAGTVQIFAMYLQRMVLPLGMSPEYIDRAAGWFDLGTILCGLGLLGTLGLGVKLALGRRRPLIAWCILTTAAWLVPVSNLIPLPNMEADRFTYLPGIPVAVGLAAALLWCGEALARRTLRPELRWVPVAIVLVIQGSAAQAHARVYRSDMRIWETARARAPGSARTEGMAGLLRLKELQRARVRTGRFDAGLAARIRGHCANAVRLDPRDPLGHACRGRLALAEQDWVSAHAALTRTVELGGPRVDLALAALGQVGLDLDDQDQRSRALERLTTGLSTHPYSADLAAAAGRIHHRLGDVETALRHYRRARSLRPERWEVVAWGMELALDLGDASAALEVWQQHANLLQDADPAVMAGLTRRTADLSRLALARPHPLLDSGVFPP